MNLQSHKNPFLTEKMVKEGITGMFWFSMGSYRSAADESIYHYYHDTMDGRFQLFCFLYFYWSIVNKVKTKQIRCWLFKKRSFLLVGPCASVRCCVHITSEVFCSVHYRLRKLKLEIFFFFLSNIYFIFIIWK